jgi:osmoprotectant transport system ATP-binding protein
MTAAQSVSRPAPALEAIGAVKRYGPVTALDGVDLEVPRGTTCALVGESGCGKTTLLRLFNRMVEPGAGEVRVDGEPVAGRDPVALRRGIGYVQQEAGLLPHWTVGDNVALVPKLLGWDAGRRAERTREVLEAVRLPAEHFADRYPAQLSGGQRQRAAIARALAADPPIVLLDEPLGALDALTRMELRAELAALQERLGKTFLLVTHDLDEAFALGDRVGVMKEGRLLRLAPPDELTADPGDDYVARLLALRPGAAS